MLLDLAIIIVMKFYLIPIDLVLANDFAIKSIRDKLHFELIIVVFWLRWLASNLKSMLGEDNKWVLLIRQYLRKFIILELNQLFHR